jgi:hypothetical protein
VFAADTLSIATMELVDNAVMALVPGAMDAGLVNPVFWLSMMLALAAAFVAAFPVNRYLLTKGKGHALTMRAGGHHRHHDQDGVPHLDQRHDPDGAPPHPRSRTVSRPRVAGPVRGSDL